MVPLRLHLSNFLSYGQEGGDLDLGPIHLACLSGANGNGKSAMVDAITWTLWGKSRAAREDDLLRHGTTDMEVELEFSCNHDIYRVIRKRSRRPSSSTVSLELAVRDGETYKSITGNSVGETEKAIGGILRLSYETFINSSLLLQGRADLFTTKRPAERKEVLAEILGLGQYEVLAEQARTRERDQRARAEQLSLRLEELDRFLAGLPELRRRLAEAQDRGQALVRERAETEARVREQEGRAQSLVGLQDMLQRQAARLTTIGREQAEIRDRLAATDRADAAADALLTDEPRLRTGVRDLHEARQEGNRLGQLMVQLRSLERRAAEANQVIAGEKARLSADLRAAQASMRAMQTAADALKGMERDWQAARTKGATVVDLQDRQAATAARLAQLTEQVGGRRAGIEALQRTCQEQREKILLLRRADAVCPTCRGPLSEERRQQVIDEAMREGITSKADIERERAALAAAQSEHEEVKITLEGLATAIRAAQQARLKEAELAEKARGLAGQAAQAEALQASLTQTSTALDKGDFAPEARLALASLEQNIAAVGYDEARHRALLAHIEQLSPMESALASLEHARSAKQHAELERASALAQQQALADEEKRLREESEPLRVALKELPAVREKLTEVHRVLLEQRANEEQASKQIGALQSQVAEGERRGEERTRTAADHAEADLQAWAHRELAVIFGKRGIQAMLIENALPDLEEDANDLLARLTDNSTQVKFNTQRQGTGGRAIDTLEIQIADTMGTRPYEMFSGGEAFRINFAIRIALSKLLTRYAGADLSFLLIDEGFGTQDEQGRDRLVEAISAIAEDFEKILVVTHIDELKDRFDVHIEVSKGPAGSQISVSAA